MVLAHPTRLHVALARALATLALLVTVGLATPDPARAAPVNDDIDDAIELPANPAGWTYSGSTVGATIEPGEPMPGMGQFATWQNYQYAIRKPAADSVWFRWTATASGSHVLTYDTEYDAFAEVYRGTAFGSLVALHACDDCGTATEGELRFVADAGETYSFVLHGYYGGEGTYELEFDPVPSNDAFTSPMPITFDRLDTVRGAGATSEVGEPDHGGLAAEATTWYTFSTATATDVVLQTEGTAHDTVVAVYRGNTLGTLVEEASNDDARPGVTWSRVRFTTVGGRTYRVAVGRRPGAGRAAGTILLQTAEAPSNDDFADATVLTASGSSYSSISRASATNEAGEPLHAGRDDGSRWYVVTPSTATTYSLDVYTHDYRPSDLAVAVYTGSAIGTLTEVVASDDAGIAGVHFDPAVTWQAAAGQTYRIALTKAGGGKGSLLLTSNLAPNDDFADATVLTGEDASASFDHFATSLEPGEPDHAGIGAPGSRWYRWTATTTGAATLTTISWDVSDAALAVYTGASVGALTPVTSNRDAGPGPPVDPWDGWARARFSTVAGQTYHIAVTGDRGDELMSGYLQLLAGAPANDDFADAEVLTGSRVIRVIDCLGLTGEYGEPLHGTYPHAGVENGTAASAWYRWTAPATGTVALDGAGGDMEGHVSMYEGSTLRTLRRISQEDPYDEGLTGVAQVVAGETYHIGIECDWWASAGSTRLGLEVTAANDKFASAVSMAGSAWSDTQSTGGATKDPGEPAHAGDAGGRSLWWTWTAPTTGTTVLTTVGSEVDTLLAVYRGSAVNGLTWVASSDDDPIAGDGTSRLALSHVAGFTYRIAVDAKAAASGRVRLTLAPPDNDRITESITLATPDTSTVDVGRAAVDLGEPAPAGIVLHRSAWWEWTAPYTGMATIDMTGSTIASRVLGVYTGAGYGSLTSVGHAIQGVESVSLAVTSGTTYRIQAGTRSPTATGSITVKIDPAPANDSFASPTIVSVSSATTSGISASRSNGATREAGEPVHAGVAGVGSTWWRVTPSYSGTLVLDTFGSSADTTIAVYTGAAIGSLVAVASDTSSMSPHARVSFAVTAGVQYRVAIEDEGAVRGPVRLRWNPGSNDQFADAEPLVGLPVTSAVVNTTFATTEPGEPGAHADPLVYGSVWYTWTAPSSGPVSARPMISSGGTMVVEVYTGASLATLVPVDAGHRGSGAGFDAVAGTTYRIRVRGDDAFWWSPDDRAVFDLRIAPQVVGDSPQTAPLIAGPLPASVAGSLVDATDVDAEPTGVVGQQTTWHRFVPGVSGPYEITIAPSSVALAVATMPTPTDYHDIELLAPLAGRYDLVAGTTYYIRASATPEIPFTIDVRDASPPPNDHFASATSYVSGLIFADVDQATRELGEPDHAGLGAINGSVWYSYVPATTGWYGVSALPQSGSDPFLAVYTGASVGALTLVAEEDDDESYAGARPQVFMNGGVTYHIAVGVKTEATKPGYQFRITPAMPHDLFAAPRVIGARPFTDTWDYGPATSEGAQDDSNSGWYEWTADTSAPVTAHTQGTTDHYDTRIAVFTGASLGSLTLVAQNDEHRASGSGNWAAVTFTPTIGVTYRIRVSLESPLDYAYVKFSLDRAPEHDSFSSALNISDPASNNGAWGSWNDFAGTEVGEPVHDGVAAASRTIWYRFTATSTRAVRLDTFSSNHDTVLAVYTGGSVGTLVPVVSNDDAGGTTQSRVEFTANAGTTYRIAVAGKGAGGQVYLRRGGGDHDQIAEAAVVPGAGGSATLDIGYSGPQPGEPGFQEESSSNSTYRGRVWATWTAAASKLTRIDGVGTTNSSQFEVYEGSTFGALTLIGTGAAYSSNHLPVVFDAVAGTTYSIAFVPSGSGASATVNVRPRADNDDFAAAEVLPGWTATDTETTINSTREVGEPDHAGAVGLSSIWYSWTAPATARATVRTSASSFDTVLAVYTGASVGALAPVTASDDVGSSTEASASFDAVSGQTYRIAVDGYAGASGVTTLLLNARPVNDDFADAITIDGDVGALGLGPNANATVEPSEPAHAGGAAQASVWWTWTPTSTGAVTIDTLGSTFDTRLAVYTGASLGSLAVVASNDDAGAGPHSSVTFVATAGVTYRIAVDGAGGATGDVRVRVAPGLPLVPVLVAPIGGADAVGLQPTVSVQFEHEDPAVLGGVEVEICRQATDPGGTWSATCATGYRAIASAMLYGDGGVVPVALGAPDLVAGQTYVWRARGTDGLAWSAWSSASSFVARAGATLAISTLGHGDAARSTTSPFTLGLGAITAGSTTMVGPSGSGQLLPGPAVRLALTADVASQVSWHQSRPNSGTALLPVGALQWRDSAAAPTEGIATTSWTAIATTSTIVESDPAGNRTYEWDLRLDTPADQKPGAYTSSGAITIVATP